MVLRGLKKLLVNRNVPLHAPLYCLVLAVCLFALIYSTGINPTGQIDAWQTFWGTLLAETYNFYKIIPILTLTFLLWLKTPHPYYLFTRLITPSRSLTYYYRQLLSFMLVVLIAWSLIFGLLTHLLAVNPQNTPFGVILTGTYLLNLTAFLSVLLLLSLRFNRVSAAIIITGLLYLDQWLSMHFNQSILFYHGLITSTLPRGTNLATVLYDVGWCTALIGVCLFFNFLTLRHSRLINF